MAGAPSQDVGIVELNGIADDAEVHLDGSFYGLASAFPHGAIPMRAGLRKIEVRQRGSLPWRTELQVEARSVHTIDVELWPAFEEVEPDAFDDDDELLTP